MYMNRDKVFIFGRGAYYVTQKKYLREKYEIVGFLDNAIKDECNEDGEIIINPNYVSNVDPEEKYKIVIVSKSFIDMYKQLKNMKISDDRIILECKDNSVKIQNDQIGYLDMEDCFYEVNTYEEYLNRKRMDVSIKYKDIKGLLEINKQPFDTHFGAALGHPTDRYYIGKFLEKNKQLIKGTVMEVGENRYINEFGGTQVTEIILAHVKGWNGCKVVNLETGEGVIENSLDCYICTQVLQYVFDIQEAFKNIYKMLKPNGVALITLPGIKSLCTSDDDNWGEFWSFTEKSVSRLCGLVANDGEYEIETYGNVKSTIAYLYGISSEMLSSEELDYCDKQYPFLISVVLKNKKR